MKLFVLILQLLSVQSQIISLPTDDPLSTETIQMQLGDWEEEADIFDEEDDEAYSDEDEEAYSDEDEEAYSEEDEEAYSEEEDDYFDSFLTPTQDLVDDYLSTEDLPQSTGTDFGGITEDIQLGSAGDSECHDKAGSACAGYKNSGFCETYYKVKHSICRLTCGTCIADDTGLCADKPPQMVCSRFKSKGYCTMFEEVRDSICRETCGTCSDTDSLGAVGDSKESVKKCNDKAGSACVGYKNKGFCETYSKVKNGICRLTCGTCTDDNDAGLCADKPPLAVCLRFKAKGYCTRFDDVRTSLCRETCGTCSGSELCADKPSQAVCSRFKAKGYCTRFDDVRTSICRETCGTCSNTDSLGAVGDSEESVNECYDKAGSACVGYKNSGFCETYNKVKHSMCRLTCRTCIADDNAGLCADKPPQVVCSRFKAKGYCTRFNEVKDVICRETCGTCSDTQSLGAVGEESVNECYDKSGSACVGYRNRGYCETYYKVKHSICRLTCGTCIAEFDTESCDDQAPQVVCQRLQGKGYCSQFVDVRETMCQNTCGNCGSDIF